MDANMAVKYELFNRFKFFLTNIDSFLSNNISKLSLNYDIPVIIATIMAL